MTDPIRVALDRLHEYAAAHPQHDTDQLVARARAAHAQPHPAGDVTDEELLNLVAVQWRGAGFGINPSECEEEAEPVEVFGGELVAFARAAIALALSRRAPVQAAEGEVAELVGAIEAEARKERNSGHLHSLTANELARIAALLQHRQPPQPVAVSERPWEREGWCDEAEKCWMGWPGGFDDATGLLPSYRYCSPRMARLAVLSLPHNALPLPSPEAP